MRVSFHVGDDDDDDDEQHEHDGRHAHASVLKRLCIFVVDVGGGCCCVVCEIEGGAQFYACRCRDGIAPIDLKSNSEILALLKAAGAVSAH